MPTEHYNDKKYTLEELEQIRQRANKLFPEMKLIDMEMYPHDGGVIVEKETVRQWVYYNGRDYQVPYQWALWKVLRRLKE